MDERDRMKVKVSRGKDGRCDDGQSLASGSLVDSTYFSNVLE